MTYAGDITPRAAWELLRSDPDAVLVDVRTHAEWHYVGVPDTSTIERPTHLIEWVGYPDGARNEHFLEQLKESGVDGSRPVVFLCRSGQRSIGAAIAATAAGIGPSYNVLDGFEGATDAEGHRGATGWRAAGLPWRQS
ncbi:rhodanese-like domain-containing protein [Rhodococcus sp. PAMC28707]|uniref:rhodanese-like domain-containing protein n=1 Tax=unclassified Rhodococcus (in: high G+C Gram-positive bacteria) TaxID=192944 RepID=UPI00109E2B8C|nr:MULTISPECIES: rhodanese-like domain-containing protein [unclassified Rhodococcus (in: high G+C Gram-positive bacteria)]QCB49027.1 rhodanese-like domain-containing protein [Rhodococcus sp. PAMC28705]QCB59285.1 rhodanese-like domain-containing protein [Rhodococcus sp. PAMC28707]